MNEVVDNIAHAAEQLNSQASHIGQSVELQEQPLGGIVTSMNEMNATVVEVCRNASNASTSSGLACDKARDGSDVVQKVVAAVGEVQSKAEQMKGSLNDLSEQVGAIATTAEEQSSASEEIAKAVDDISRGSRETAQGMAQATHMIS